MLTVVKERYLTLEYEETSRCIIQTWKNYFRSSDFREGVEKTNDLFRKTKASRFLVDISQASVIAKADTDWAANTAIPLAIENGLKHYAFVIPTSAFTQMSLNNFQSEVNPLISIRPFDNFALAKKWLLEQKS